MGQGEKTTSHCWWKGEEGLGIHKEMGGCNKMLAKAVTEDEMKDRAWESEVNRGSWLTQSKLHRQSIFSHPARF